MYDILTGVTYVEQYESVMYMCVTYYKETFKFRTLSVAKIISSIWRYPVFRVGVQVNKKMNNIQVYQKTDTHVCIYILFVCKNKLICVII